MLYHGFKYILPFTQAPAVGVTKNTDGGRDLFLLPANLAGSSADGLA